jgi:hypothetical protein
MATTVVTAMRTTAALVSLVVAPINPSLCPHAARVSLIIDQSRCSNAVDQIEVVFYPIQIGFADDTAGKYFAAAIILWPFAFLFVLLHYALVRTRAAPPENATPGDVKVLHDLAMQRYMFPSLTVSTLTLFFWQPLIMSSVTVLSRGTSDGARLGAFATLIFAVAFASFVARWYSSRRTLVEFVTFDVFYFRRHAFNTLVLKGGDVTRLLGIITIAPVPEDDDDKKKIKDKDEDKKDRKKKDDKAKKDKKKRRDKDDRSSSSSSSSSDDSDDDRKRKRDKGRKKDGKKDGKKSAGKHDDGEEMQPRSSKSKNVSEDKAKKKDVKAAKPDDAEEVAIPLVPLTAEMTARVEALLMPDWQQETADVQETQAAQDLLTQGVAVIAPAGVQPQRPTLRRPGALKRGGSGATPTAAAATVPAGNASMATLLSNLSFASSRGGPEGKRRLQNPWLPLVTPILTKLFIGKGRWADVPGRYGFSAKNGFMFQHYAAGRQWFMLVELAFCTVFGILEGIKPTTFDGCWRIATSNFAFLALYTLMLIVLRPFTSLWDNVTFSLVTLQQAASCAMLIASGEDLDRDIRSTGEIYAFACLSVVTFKGVLDVGWKAYVNSRKRTAWRRLKGEASDSSGDDESSSKPALTTPTNANHTESNSNGDTKTPDPLARSRSMRQDNATPFLDPRASFRGSFGFYPEPTTAQPLLSDIPALAKSFDFSTTTSRRASQWNPLTPNSNAADTPRAPKRLSAEDEQVNVDF